MDLSRLFFIARSFIFYYFTGLFSLVFTLFYAIIITVYNFEIIVNQGKVTMGKYYEKKTLIEQLQKRAVELGRVPAPEDMIDPPAKAYLGFSRNGKRQSKLPASVLLPLLQRQSRRKLLPSPKFPNLLKQSPMILNPPKKLLPRDAAVTLRALSHRCC